MYAECPNAVYLPQGSTVEDCDRMGLSIPYNDRVRKELIENEYNKKIVIEQKKMITLKDLMVTEVKGQNDVLKTEDTRLRKDNDDLRRGSDWKLWVGVGIGIVATVLGAWGLGQIGR